MCPIGSGLVGDGFVDEGLDGFLVFHEEVAQGFVDVGQAGRVAHVAAFGESVFPALDRLDDVCGDLRFDVVLLGHEGGEGGEVLLRGALAGFGRWVFLDFDVLVESGFVEAVVELFDRWLFGIPGRLFFGVNGAAFADGKAFIDFQGRNLVEQGVGVVESVLELLLASSGSLTARLRWGMGFSLG